MNESYYSFSRVELEQNLTVAANLMLDKLVEQGVLTPEQARPFKEDYIVVLVSLKSIPQKVKAWLFGDRKEDEEEKNSRMILARLREPVIKGKEEGGHRETDKA